MTKRLYPKHKGRRVLTFDEWIDLCIRCRRHKKRPNYFYCDNCLGITDEWKNRNLK